MTHGVKLSDESDDLVKRLREQRTINLGDLNEVRAYLDEMSVLHHQVADALSARGVGEGVRVKELEWTGDWPLEAETIMGTYEIWGGYPDGRFKLIGPYHKLKTFHVTPEEAKAAAQADYTSRIRSALEPEKAE